MLFHTDNPQDAEDLFIGIFDPQIDALHHEVLIHRRTGETTGILDQCTDSDTDTGVGIFLTKQLDFTLVRNKVSTEQFHSCGLTGTVFADKAVNTANGNGHIQSIQCIQSTEAFGKSANFNCVHCILSFSQALPVSSIVSSKMRDVCSALALL